MGLKNQYEALNEKCGILNTITPLSITSAMCSGILMLLTIPLNTLIIYFILKMRRGKITFFYKLLLNIAIADLMTGLLADPASMNFHVKEARQQLLSLGETYLLHLSTFFTDAVALITMTFLSCDRMAALRFPVKYHNGMKARYQNVIVASVYPLALILTAPYFWIEFIGQLAVFSTLNVTLAILSLVATTIVFKRVTRRKKKKQTLPSDDSSNDVVPNHNTGCIKNPEASNRQIQKTFANTTEDTTRTKKGNSLSLTKIETKVTKTFLIMVCVFAVMYLPTCVTMLYMNSCGENCDCLTVHVMRDISVVSILSSSVFRPLIYLTTIRQLREALMNLCGKIKQRSVRTTSSQNTLHMN